MIDNLTNPKTFYNLATYLYEYVKNMNILISSTRQWNPGDEFIRYGVRSLLTSLYNHTTINWLLWNRNPDLFVSLDEPKIKDHFLTNSLAQPLVNILKMIVFAGTPEWHGPPLAKVYQDLLRDRTMPLLALGIGSHELPKLNSHELEVFARPSTFITTRSYELADYLNSLLPSKKAKAIVCPAIFCAPEHLIAKPTSEKPIGIILQSSTVVNQSISEQLVQSTLLEIRKRNFNQQEIIAFYIDEFCRFSQTADLPTIRYSYEPNDYLQMLSQYKGIITSRLHGAIAALSLGIPTVLIAEETNKRINTTAKIFGDLLPVYPVDKAFDFIFNMSEKERLDYQQAILDFKNSQKEIYIGLLNNFLSAQNSE